MCRPGQARAGKRKGALVTGPIHVYSTSTDPVVRGFAKTPLVNADLVVDHEPTMTSPRELARSTLTGVAPRAGMPNLDSIRAGRGDVNIRTPRLPVRIAATMDGRDRVTIAVHGRLDRVGIARLRADWPPGAPAGYATSFWTFRRCLAGIHAWPARWRGRDPSCAVTAKTWSSSPPRPGCAANSPARRRRSIPCSEASAADTHPRRCVMLSDRDRETLDEIHHCLMIEDPQFAAAFNNEARGLEPHGRGGRRIALTVMIVIALMLSVVMIVVHAVGSAWLLIAVAGWLMLLRWGAPRG